MAHLLDTMSPARIDGHRDVVKNERRQTHENTPYGMAEIHLDQALAPANASLVIAGDVEAAVVKPLVEKWLADVPTGQPAPPWGTGYGSFDFSPVRHPAARYRAMLAGSVIIASSLMRPWHRGHSRTANVRMRGTEPDGHLHDDRHGRPRGPFKSASRTLCGRRISEPPFQVETRHGRSPGARTA